MSDTIDMTDDGGSDKNWKLARDKITKLEAQVAQLKPLAINGIAHQAGFNVDSGATKLLLEKFAGDFDPTTATPGAFVEFAKGYDIEPNLAGAATPPPSAEEDKTNENQMDQLQSNADQLAANGRLPTQQDDVAEQILAAEQSGDIATSISLKLAGLTNE